MARQSTPTYHVVIRVAPSAVRVRVAPSAVRVRVAPSPADCFAVDTCRAAQRLACIRGETSWSDGATTYTFTSPDRPATFALAEAARSAARRERVRGRVRITIGYSDGSTTETMVIVRRNGEGV